LSNVLEVLAVLLDPFVPVILSRPELEQANAALLVIANTTAATKLSNRLDIGSPPFRKPGTCRPAKIADPTARDKPAAPADAPETGARRENGHIRSPLASRHGGTRFRPLGPRFVLHSASQDIQEVSTQCHYRPYRRASGVSGSTPLP
jgi:hypothetical protein